MHKEQNQQIGGEMHNDSITSVWHEIMNLFQRTLHNDVVFVVCLSLSKSVGYVTMHNNSAFVTEWN